MAVTESRPAHHDGEPPSADVPGPPRRTTGDRAAHPGQAGRRVTFTVDPRLYFFDPDTGQEITG